MIYCDTSLLVAALTVEQYSLRVHTWLAAQDAGALCISRWVIVEFHSALSIKLRRGDITAAERARVLSNWQILQRDNLTVLPVRQAAFDLATRLCDRHDSGLRGGDAVHVAIAALGGYPIATLDTVMAQAAIAAGVDVTPIG